MVEFPAESCFPFHRHSNRGEVERHTDSVTKRRVSQKLILKWWRCISVLASDSPYWHTNLYNNNHSTRGEELRSSTGSEKKGCQYKDFVHCTLRSSVEHMLCDKVGDTSGRTAEFYHLIVIIWGLHAATDGILHRTPRSLGLFNSSVRRFITFISSFCLFKARNWCKHAEPVTCGKTWQQTKDRSGKQPN